ncbi:HlyD family type I secretion periplasmic adaptor subunit [uncultured Pseudoteredinibacter sp.]|uniref:HlyD family type I secretion periplasmic adaptor subunit n=1 Tax=uncultured Pseudoteredinibacter sp. TaxID=1641701 RepID=UPI0026363513|nr:HlyD family type I secretion periplasmic adaptor subunit [uncultured Pseudoteredinibacter sp.]
MSSNNQLDEQKPAQAKGEADNKSAPAVSVSASSVKVKMPTSASQNQSSETLEKSSGTKAEDSKVVEQQAKAAEQLDENLELNDRDISTDNAAVDASEQVAVQPQEDAPDGQAPLPAAMPQSGEKKRKWFEGDKELIQEDLDYMSSAAAAVLQQSPRGGQQLLWAICTFVIVAIVWASLAYVDEFTRGEGKVIPSSQVKIVQHQEGGIVAELYVREGQAVKAQEPLLRLDDTQFSSSLREADVTLDQLKAKAARLSYEADGKALPEQPMDGVSELLWSQARALYLSRQEEQKSKDQVLVQQVAQRRQELSELKARRDQHQRSYRLLDKELQMSKPLVGSGAMSEVELLRLERQVNDLYGELNGAELAIPRAESSLQEARDKLQGAKLAFRNESRKELADVRLELQRLSESSGALEDRVDRTVVVSPVAGTIKQVMVNTIGGVVQPGMDLLQIVPTEDSLLVEAKIRPTDIAFLHPGQEAIVKFTAYDFSIHGGLKGNVTHISPDTIVDEEGESFYTVKVETEKAFLGSEDTPLPIIPGMTVSVDVLTGEKTVLDYILKPILKTKQLALRER